MSPQYNRLFFLKLRVFFLEHHHFFVDGVSTVSNRYKVSFHRLFLWVDNWNPISIGL